MDNVKAILEKGHELFVERKLDKALTRAESALELAQNDDNFKIEALLLLGTIKGVLGKYSGEHTPLNDGLGLLDQAISINNIDTNPQRHVDLTNRKGQTLIDLKSFEKAEHFFQEAYTLSKKVDYLKGMNVALSGLSQIYLNLNKFDKALQYATECKEITESSSDPALLINVYMSLGYVYARRHRYSEILDYFEKVLNLSRQINDAESEILALMNVAIAYSSRQDFKRSLKYLLQALEKGEAINFRLSNVKALVNISTIFYVLYNHEEALKRFHRILDDYFDILDTNTLTVLYYNIGDTYVRADQIDDAQQYFQKCLEAGEKAGYKQVVALAQTQIARTFVHKKEYDKALDFAFKSVKLFDELGETQGKHIALITIGDIFFQKKDFQKSISYTEEGLELAKEFQAKDEQARAYFQLSEVYRCLDDFQNAYKFHVLYAEKQIEQNNVQKDNQLMDMEIKYETREKEKQIELLTKTREKQESEFNEKISRLKMQALQAQMNPHFIFNSMNAIQQFITTNDSESAMLYLSSFARLIRLIFEYSQRTSISLSDEIEFLKLYLKLENLRFKNKIEVNLSLSSEIDKENTKVPPLLVQPLIENAFKHGLMHKASGGKLEITFYQKGEMLVCSVEDNGVGRTQASKLGSWRPKEYRSSGLKIINERLELLNGVENDTNNSTTKLMVTDLFDDNEEPSGTRIDLFIEQVE
ncbi:MAG: tetratricopeptide repeat protein [Bacteroidota bacterium]